MRISNFPNSVARCIAITLLLAALPLASPANADQSKDARKAEAKALQEGQKVKREESLREKRAEREEHKAGLQQRNAEGERDKALARENRRPEKEKFREGGDRDGETKVTAVKPIRGIFLGLQGKALIVGIGDSAKEHLVPFTTDTRFSLNGQPCEPQALKNGAFLTITQAEGMTTAVEARAPRGRGDGDPKPAKGDPK